MLAALDALELGRTKLAAKVRQRVAEKPAARGLIEAVTKRCRPSSSWARRACAMLLSDSILSTRGVRPWEDAEG